MTFHSHCSSWEAGETKQKPTPNQLTFQFILLYFQILTGKDIFKPLVTAIFFPSLLLPKQSQPLPRYQQNHSEFLRLSFLHNWKWDTPGCDHQEDHRRLTLHSLQRFSFQWQWGQVSAWTLPCIPCITASLLGLWSPAPQRLVNPLSLFPFSSAPPGSKRYNYLMIAEGKRALSSYSFYRFSHLELPVVLLYLIFFWLSEIVKTQRIFSWFFKVSDKWPDPTTPLLWHYKTRKWKYYYREPSDIKNIADTSLAT